VLLDPLLVPVVVTPPVPEVVDEPLPVAAVVPVPVLLELVLVLLDAVVDAPLLVVLDEVLVPAVELPPVDPVEDVAAAVVVPLTVLVVVWPEEHAPTNNVTTASVPAIRSCADARGLAARPRQPPAVILIATPIEKAQQ
jgi:hypothetical protein